jgi:hypothetical protein
MERRIPSRTGPAQRYVNGRLVNGFIELTGDYLGFRPIGDQDDIGFLQWFEFKSIKYLKANMLRPAIIQVARIGSNAPLLLAVPEPDAWIKLISDAHSMFQQAKQNPNTFGTVRKKAIG